MMQRHHSENLEKKQEPLYVYKKLSQEIVSSSTPSIPKDVANLIMDYTGLVKTSQLEKSLSPTELRLLKFQKNPTRNSFFKKNQDALSFMYSIIMLRKLWKRAWMGDYATTNQIKIFAKNCIEGYKAVHHKDSAPRSRAVAA